LSVGPKTGELLKFIADPRPSFSAAPGLPTDREWGLINRTTLVKLRNAGLIEPFSPGEPLRLTKEGRAAVPGRRPSKVQSRV
jgi:hypothetical protein